MNDKTTKPLRVIISGGGTAGHIHPAIAVADVLRPAAEILFVGAEGKMEMERVPNAGYEIVGLPVAGLQRGGIKALLSKNNFLLPFKIWKSMRRARKIVRNFRPEVVIGFGGYASAPVLLSAQKMGVPTIIQEQNSYAGLTNKKLGKRAKAICVAYEGMERFFPAGKIVMTGNPLRAGIAGELIQTTEAKRAEGYAHFGLDPKKKTILVVGGSLGTRTLNRSMLRWLDNMAGTPDIQVIWQNGKYYEEQVAAELTGRGGLPSNVWRGAFVERMDLAYAVADVVIARAGAGTVSELELVGRPVIFVPSPNVAEDHQTKNAMALVKRDAALIVPDSEAEERVVPEAMALLNNPERCEEMVWNIRAMGRPEAARDVAEEVLKAAGHPQPDRTPDSGTVKSQAAVAGPEENRVKKYNRIYFIGIGGIGMSALARYFQHEGYGVAGYDRTPSPLTAQLEAEGIPVHYEDHLELIPAPFKEKDDTLVVYTPAVPADMAELTWFRGQGFEVLKRSRTLGIVGEGKDVMAVAGTHGKTTTTTMVAWFNAVGAGEGSAFLGGISKNFKSNLVLGSGKRLAAEADEFDRSFLQLYPKEAVITSVDPDHLDIYGSREAIRAAFETFVSQIRPGGALVIKQGLELTIPRTDINIYRYSVEDSTADFHAENLEVDAGGYYTFDLVCPDRKLTGCRLGIPGLVNVENCVGAVGLVWQEGFDNEKMKEAIATFKGVERRFDFWVNEPDPTGRSIVYMDDYAHHPEELKAMLSSMKKMFPTRELTVVFQPHLYTRTQDFAAEFSEVLGLADRILLMPIYPAREEPIAGVESELIWNGMTPESRQKTRVVQKKDLLQEIETLPLEVLVTAGAGDIDRFCRPVAEVVKARNEKIKQA